jgi:hypothetical protein
VSAHPLRAPAETGADPGGAANASSSQQPLTRLVARHRATCRSIPGAPMGFEPDAARRLRWIRRTTTDSVLRQQLAGLLGEEEMPSVPSAALRIDIDVCNECNRGTAAGREGLCAVHRASWNQEICESRQDTGDGATAYLDGLVRRALDSDLGGSDLLTAFGRQTSALQMIWDAHQRGAVDLPAPIAAVVDRAVRTVPDLLSRSSTQMARAG